MKLNFLIIGAQKSASTYLHYCLAQHPDIHIHKVEIPIFEDPDFAGLSDAYFDTLFRGREEPRLGIKRPSCIGRPEVPERICRLVPHAKLIAVLRNPVERALSAYFHYMSGSYIPVAEGDIGLRRLLDGKYASNYRRAHQILEFGKYYKYLSMYEPFFQAGTIMLIRQEEFLKDPIETLQQVFAFLDVDPAFVPSKLHARRQPGYYNLSLQRIMRFAGAISHDKNEDNTRAQPKQNPVPRLAGRVLFQVCNLLREHVVDNAKPRIDALCLADLHAYYADDIAHLERMTGWDLASWKGPSRGSAGGA